MALYIADVVRGPLNLPSRKPPLTQMYTNAELQEILETLRNGAESEVVEFKEAKSTFSKNNIGEYFSALANEANLQNQPNAWLVFGEIASG